MVSEFGTRVASGFCVAERIQRAMYDAMKTGK